MKEHRFNGEYQKTGSVSVTDADKKRVEKADADLEKLIGSDEDSNKQ